MEELQKLFNRVIQQDDVFSKLGITKQQLYQYRNRAKQGKPIQEQTMRNLLTKLGYECAQPELWVKIPVIKK